MRISRRSDDTWKFFLKRTISAQLHLLGLILAFVGLCILLPQIDDQDYKSYVACFIFGATAICVFSVSTVYHFLHDGFQISNRLEHLFEKLDHISIYSFIAGSYTAILINTLPFKWQPPMIVFIWTGALIGILYTLFKSQLPKWMQKRGVYTGSFVLLGWGLLICIKQVVNNLSSYQLFLLLAGAATYSVGAIIYALKKPTFFPGIFGFHELWHLAVILGFSFHYALVFQFYI